MINNNSSNPGQTTVLCIWYKVVNVLSNFFRSEYFSRCLMASLLYKLPCSETLEKLPHESNGRLCAENSFRG